MDCGITDPSGFAHGPLSDAERAHRFGVPDLAVLAEGHHEGEKYLEIFNNILDYLRHSGATMSPGHTLQIEQGSFLRFRSPREDEPFLESQGATLVVEPIGRDEINA